jgi:hypothetical protein
MNTALQFRLLRVVLVFSAFVWGVSAFGLFLGWESAASVLQGLGAKPIPYDPMLDYWLRMAAGAFTLVGTGYLLLALFPRKYTVMLPWFGWIMVVEGFILLLHGWRLELAPFPFWGDVSASFLGGVGILMLRKSVPTS